MKNGNLTLYSKENLKYKEYDSNNKKIVEKEEKDGSANSDAINYYNETIRFSNWVQINLIDKAPYLKVGNNIVKITVTAEDGSTRLYTFNIL